MGNEKLIFYLRTNQYYTIFLIIIVTFFVIATKKVTKEKSRQTVLVNSWSLIVYRNTRKTNDERRETNLPARSAWPLPLFVVASS
jgi:hypothetical protein